MRRLTRLLSAAPLSLCLATSAYAQDLITSPDWLERPSGADVGRAYPAVAQTLGFEGRATISCAVSDVGMLEDCRVASEEPAELGFGHGALSMSPLFRMKPMTRNGQPVTGGTVRIPIRFMLPKPPAFDLPKATSPQKLQMARELARRYSALGSPHDPFEREAQEISVPTPDVPEATRIAAAAALREAAAAKADAAEEAVAHALASAFSEPELAAMATFLASPAGAVYLPDAEMVDFWAAYNQRFVSRTTATARERFCATRRCNLDASLAQLIGEESEAVIQAPVWVEAPSLEAISAAGPVIAPMIGLNGAVRLTCKVTSDGLLENCKTMAETPAGLGFADGAMQLSRAFRLSPVMVGQGATGETVAVRIHFPARDLPPVAPPSVAPASPSPRMALARQLAALRAAELLTPLQDALKEMAGQPLPGADRLVHGDALEALLVSSRAASAAGEEEMAGYFAERYSEAQLAAALEFWATPAAKAFRETTKMQPLMRAVQSKISDDILTDARARYCRTRPCAVMPAASVPPPQPSRPAPGP